MWWFWNKLFGWDYCIFEDEYGPTIGRVIGEKDNTVVFYRRRGVKMIKSSSLINESRGWISSYLTCDSEKYETNCFDNLQ